jgi:hypothetical protein
LSIRPPAHASLQFIRDEIEARTGDVQELTARVKQVR